jgi:CheY-like chemotaxis protein
LSAAKSAADLVKQILTFSRQTEPQRVLLDLTPIVKEGLKFLRGSIPSTIEIRQEIGSLIGKVEADPTQMHQVLMNLCSNAAQAMKETTGVMTVELAEITLNDPYSARHLALKPGRYVKLSVSDTGYGIPPENIDRIFDPYFTTKGIGEGTGLGLAVIHGIVSGHGGAITVYSIPGQGSTFNVFLPVAERDFECEGVSDSFAIPSGKERILFVDDEEILLEMGQTILERLGYRVVTFLDPFKALEAYRSDPRGFDLVLTDLMMPKMTGLVLTKQIKIINPDVPIILCTGFGHKFTTEEAEEIGFIGILSKPISKKDLALTVRKALDTKLKQGEPPIDRCS